MANDSPERNQSLKEMCINHIETMILSGEFQVGQKLPAERDLAAQLRVSRPVLHEALVELAARGLVTITPRHGVRVNDYSNTGSLALLDSLVAYREGLIEEPLRQDLFAFRKLIEKETAILSAIHRTDQHLGEFAIIADKESRVDCSNPDALLVLDFEFHLLVARASGNSVYPLILNSFRNAYTSYTRAFFAANICSDVIQQVLEYHKQLTRAIREKQSEQAGLIMVAMLTHGEENWKGE